MALDYKALDHIWGLDYNDLKASYILGELKTRDKRLSDKIEEVNKLKYEQHLIEQDIMLVLKEDVANSTINLFNGFSSEVLRKTWKHFHYKDKIEDEEEKEQCLHAYDYVIYAISHGFLNDNNDFKLTAIYDYWYGAAYDFEYQYGDETIQISIPVFCSADMKNYREMMSGYKIRFKESEHCWGLVCNGMDYHELKDKLFAWLEERKKGKKE